MEVELIGVVVEGCTWSSALGGGVGDVVLRSWAELLGGLGWLDLG